MEELSVDWSRTRIELTKLISLFACEKCKKSLQEPCSFEMCDHYFCKSCALNLINSGTNCPTCDAVLWREHLQPNLRISEAMKICQHIQDLIKIDSSEEIEDKLLCSDVNGDVDTYVFQQSPHSSPLNAKDDVYAIEDEDGTIVENYDTIDDVVEHDDKDVESDDLIVMEVEDDSDVENGGCESDDTDDMHEKLFSANYIKDSGQDEKIMNDVNENVKNENKSFCGGSLIALCKGLRPTTSKKQIVESEGSSSIDFDVSADQSLIIVDKNEVPSKEKQLDILTAVKNKDKSSNKITIPISSSPSPQKSQFSEAVSDAQFAQGVQRNPICLTKKPKVTYGGKKKGGNPVKEKSSIPLLVTNRALKTSIKERSILEFSSGTITKPISFNDMPTGEDKDDTKEDSVSDNFEDPSVFDFSSGVVTKPISFNMKSKRVLNEEINILKENLPNEKSRGPDDSSIFDFSSGTVTKPVSFKKIKDNKKTNMKTDSTTKRKRGESNDKSKDVSKKTERQEEEKTSKKVQKPKVRNLEKKNKNGETPLHAACIKGNYDRAKELLELGAQTNTKDFNGWTPLHEASNHGFTNIVALLLDHNAIIDCVAGEDNDTPLHDAVSNNRIDVTRVLLQRGAPTNIKNRIGLYPEGYACTKEMKAVFKELNMFETHNISENQLDTTVSVSNGPYVIMSTNLRALEIVEIQKCCDRFDAKFVSDFDSDVTHIVCGTNKNRICLSRTMKYLLGVLSGKWLVSYDWIIDSLKQNQWSLELNYEVKGSPNTCEGIPLKSRVNIIKCLPKLFEGCYFYLSGVFNDRLSKEKVMNLITLGGGKILYREPKTSEVDPLIAPLPHEMGKLKLGIKVVHPDIIYHAKENSAQVCCKEYIIYDDQENPSHKKIFSPVLCTAPVAWLLDCISNFQILDIQDVYDINEVVKSSQN